MLLFDSAGKPLQFWHHTAHPGVVDWDGDGAWELLVSADLGFVWYFKPENFGKAAAAFEIHREEGDSSL